MNDVRKKNKEEKVINLREFKSEIKGLKKDLSKAY